MRTSLLLASLAALAIGGTGAALAQQDMPPARAAVTPPAAGPRPGPGPQMPAGPRVGRDYTPGWTMMTPPERDELHQRLLAAKTRAECRQVMDEHRKLMADRAKDRGVTMRGPRHDPCTVLRDGGKAS